MGPRLVSNFTFDWKWEVDQLLMPGFAQFQHVGLHPTYYLVMTIQEFLDKGMPLVEFKTSTINKTGCGRFDTIGDSVYVQAGESIFVPFGTVAMPLVLQKGELKPTDSHRQLVFPLPVLDWAKNCPQVAFKELCEWNISFLTLETSRGHSAWELIGKAFDRFCEQAR